HKRAIVAHPRYQASDFLLADAEYGRPVLPEMVLQPLGSCMRKAVAQMRANVRTDSSEEAFGQQLTINQRPAQLQAKRRPRLSDAFGSPHVDVNADADDHMTTVRRVAADVQQDAGYLGI